VRAASWSQTPPRCAQPGRGRTALDPTCGVRAPQARLAGLPPRAPPAHERLAAARSEATPSRIPRLRGPVDARFLPTGRSDAGYRLGPSEIGASHRISSEVQLLAEQLTGAARAPDGPSGGSVRTDWRGQDDETGVGCPDGNQARPVLKTVECQMSKFRKLWGCSFPASTGACSYFMLSQYDMLMTHLLCMHHERVLIIDVFIAAARSFS